MIFGVQAGKFTNVARSIEVLLDYDVLSPSWIEPNVIMHQSVINTHREWIKIADHHASFCKRRNISSDLSASCSCPSHHILYGRFQKTPASLHPRGGDCLSQLPSKQMACARGYRPARRRPSL